jgi:tRNA(fMet)-specific endonuclease VapC
VIHVDSSFVIDLIRERRRRPSKAMAWLRDHPSESLGVSLFVMCELEGGVAGAEDPELERARMLGALEALTPVMPDDRFPFKYGLLLEDLQRRGRLIGEMDLLIATAAILDRAPLVTGNERHFEHVPGLRVLSYR